MRCRVAVVAFSQWKKAALLMLQHEPAKSQMLPPPLKSESFKILYGVHPEHLERHRTKAKRFNHISLLSLLLGSPQLNEILNHGPHR